MNRAQMQDTGAQYLDILKRMQALPKLVDELQTDTEYEAALKELQPVRAALGHKTPRQGVTTTTYYAPSRAGSTSMPTTTTYRTPSGATVTRVHRPMILQPTTPSITTHYKPSGAVVTQRGQSPIPPTYRQLSTRSDEPWPGAAPGRAYSMPTIAHNRIVG